MQNKEKLKRKIWELAKTNELCYDPQIDASPYDAFDGSGSEYHIMHSIKVVRNIEGDITVYNATQDDYTVIDDECSLKVVAAFITDPSFDFKRNLMPEYEKTLVQLVDANKRLDKQGIEMVKLIKQNSDFRGILQDAETRMRRAISILNAVVGEKSDKSKAVYRMLINILRGNEKENEAMQNVWQAIGSVGERQL